jgi:hypothetical protein
MPTTALETGLYNTLSAGTALTGELGGTFIYNKQAPQTPPDKFVIFQWQGGGDENESKHRTRNVIYTVRGVATTQEAAATIDGLIDGLLHLKTLTISGWTNFWTARIADVNFIEQNAGGVNRYHVGAQYRIRIDNE